MAEAAIVLPVVILTVMLLLRVFVFYLQILDKSFCEHKEAMKAWDSYRGAGLKQYSDSTDVYLLRGGILRKTLSKRIDTRVYLINEDLLVRAGSALGK